MTRCAWAGTDPLMIAYHDREWGTPVHDDQVFFEFLTLEGAQAGLSWSTILNKRENYRKAFAGFDPVKVARFKPARADLGQHRREDRKVLVAHDRDLGLAGTQEALEFPRRRHRAEPAAEDQNPRHRGTFHTRASLSNSSTRRA